MFTLGMAVLGAGVASGQDYPNKPIRLVTAAPGGALDVAARLIARGLTGSLGQQVVVDNRGGSAVIAAEIVVKAPPDGYTLLFYASAVWLLPSLRDSVRYDPVRDFLPITLATRAPHILVVHPSVPVNSVKELIVLGKARPGELNYASGPTGSSIHRAAELFRAMAGVNIVRVPYKGSAQGLNDLIAGEVQLMFPTTASAMPHVKSDRLRALAVTSAEPSALAPGLPTVAASGVPGYEAVAMTGIWAPAKTPGAIIARLNQEIVRV
ncbi:MAG: tripartite tricarboxylate transporter substrate binding protein, partial [Betaproteobacteria bacterium]|nr:tripartite tricarboxylate transporter substrate binding protein [Betaproteobacteria bacterium]